MKYGILYSPLKLSLMGAFVFLLLLLISPVRVVHEISWGGFSYIFFCYLFFATGCIFALSMRSTRFAIINPQMPSKKLYWSVYALGFLGISLRFYDKWFYRGAVSADTSLEARLILEEVSAGSLSAVAAFLYPFCYVPIFLALLRQQNSPAFPSRMMWLALFLALLPGLEATLLLSRSQLIVTSFLLFFSWRIIGSNGHLTSKSSILQSIIIFVAIIVVSATMFSMRLELMNLEVENSIAQSAYGHVIAPSLWAAEAIASQAGVGSLVLKSIIPSVQYFLHGIFEFGLLWDRESVQIFTYGTQHLSPLVKLLSILGLDIGDPAGVYPRVGVFTSFFGPLWTDFGWAGLIIMTGFGYVCTKLSALVKAGIYSAFPIYTYLCVAIFFMPVVNFLISAQGAYVVISFTVFFLSSSSAGYKKV